MEHNLIIINYTKGKDFFFYFIGSPVLFLFSEDLKVKSLCVLCRIVCLKMKVRYKIDEW